MSATQARMSAESEAPTVWILVVALSIGGAERTIVELGNGLDADRFDMEIWTIFDMNPLAEDLDDDIHVRTLGVDAVQGEEQYQIVGAENPLMYLLAPLRFILAVRRERPDVLHSFLIYDNLICRIAGLLSRETTVVNGERGFHNASKPALQAVDRLSVRLVDLIVSNSEAGAQYYADAGVDGEKLRVIPNGRQLDEYRDAVADGVRSELSIPAEATVVGTVGRLVERKGHYDLLEAWARVDACERETRLVVVGHGPERENLERRATALGIDGSVQFTGARDDIPSLLDAMDVFVFPSHWEGLPGALMEAMAAGLPIVATRVNGSTELVAHEDTGLLVPAQTPDALAEALQRVLTDQELAAQLGERAQEEAFKQYTRESMVTQFEEVYDRCTAAPDQGGVHA